MDLGLFVECVEVKMTDDMYSVSLEQLSVEDVRMAMLYAPYQGSWY